MYIEIFNIFGRYVALTKYTIGEITTIRTTSAKGSRSLAIAEALSFLTN